LFSRETIEYLKQAVAERRVTRGPLDLQVLPTTRCNAACNFCPSQCVSAADKRESAPRWLDADTDINVGVLDRLMDDLYRMGGLKRVHITGGEPLLYRRISLMLFILRKSFPDVEISLVTNGILLEKFADAIAESGISRVSISVNAARPESYARVSGVDAANLEKIKSGIRQLRSARDRKAQKFPQISVTAVLNRENHAEAEDMLKLGAESGADSVTYLALMDFPFAKDRAPFPALGPGEFARFMKDIERLQPAAREKNIWLGFTGAAEQGGRLRSGDAYKKMRCYAGYTFAMVWPDGSVRPCCNCETVLGNLSEQSFYQIWRSELAQKNRERMRQICEAGFPERCDCAECGYLYENREYDRVLAK
jgi:MoaA/NifB/PqqE/SkfB family radical SAM enzyme